MWMASRTIYIILSYGMLQSCNYAQYKTVKPNRIQLHKIQFKILFIFHVEEINLRLA